MAEDPTIQILRAAVAQGLCHVVTNRFRTDHASAREAVPVGDGVGQPRAGQLVGDSSWTSSAWRAGWWLGALAFAVAVGGVNAAAPRTAAQADARTGTSPDVRPSRFPASDAFPVGAAQSGADPAPLVHGHVLARRWVYIANNFQVADNVERVQAILKRAAAAGYNGAVLADVKFGRLDDGSLIPAYFTNLQAVLDTGRELGIALMPATANFGYSEALLWHDPNLAEGLPIVDAPFVVESGHIVAREESPPVLVNGDFEDLPASGDRFPGWAFQDEPGTATFVDRQVRRSGRASLRMQNLATTNPTSGNGRVYQRLAVEPFRAYHLSVWVRTQGFRGGAVRAMVLGQASSRTLQWNPIPVSEDQDWTRFEVIFNTLTETEVLVYLGVWAGGQGTIWWDDATIEPAGLTNLIRRPGAPVLITDETGATVYDEGRDVDPLVDPLMGSQPWSGSYDLWHAPPAIGVPATSRLNEGDRLKISSYHMVSIYGGQVTASLTEPAVFEILSGQLRSLHREFSAAGAFTGWFFSHDEIRVHGWDSAPRVGDGRPGEQLAFNVAESARLAWQADPAAQLAVWSDMFDPHHNAADTADPYYLVNGNWSGSWHGLHPAVTVVNWNHLRDRRRASAEHFAGRGHKQILAGYYDSAPAHFGDRQWLADLEGVRGIDGVMFTPWSTGHGHLEAWAEHVWGDAVWVTPTPAPTAAPTVVTTATPGTHQGSKAYLPWAAAPGRREAAGQTE